MAEYEIYAVKYAGPREGPGALVMWNQDWNQKVKRAYYIWCLKGPEGAVLVDAGMTPEAAREKKVPDYVNPVEALAGLGVEAAEVKHLILTHMHWDHACGVSLFPKAAVYVQEEEYEFWTEDPLSRRPMFAGSFDAGSASQLAGLLRKGKLVLLKGDQEILPGIQCILAPGHTVGLQAVAVSTQKGTAVLGSDCAHTFRNYKEDKTSIFITDLRAWLKSYDKLRKKASSLDILFPGHDILMTENYPLVAQNITRLV